MRRVLSAAAAVLAILLMLGCGTGTGDDGEDNRTSRRPAVKQFAQKRLPMPRHGLVRRGGRFTEAMLCDFRPERRTGLLRISVPYGAETYMARLRTVKGRQGPQVIIRPGRTATVRVSICDGETRYRLFYGAGTRWYGFHYLFGPRGAYSKADRVFPFKDGTEWRVSLSLTPNGNLGRSGMDYEDFLR